MDNDTLLEALNPNHSRWKERRLRAAHEIDIIVRKDGREYRYEGDFLKDVARALLPVTHEEAGLAHVVNLNGPVHLGMARKQREG
jgi:hypothetical protein